MKLMEVPFAMPEIGNEEINEIISVINSGWLTTASRCNQFEKEFAAFVNAKHALAVNSATAALHLGVDALGISENDKVIVPTYTFTATAEVVRYLRADPIFVDCDLDTYCITDEQISMAINENQLVLKEDSVRAVIPVHIGGHPCDMDGIMKICNSYGIKIIEDAAHALPAKYKGNYIGTFGDITCYSFYANKTMTTGEGGMLCTDNDDIALRAKVMRLHGIDRDVWDRFSTGASWEYDVVAPGYKYNMSDLSAAIGIHQLRKAEEFRRKRKRIAETYYNELKDTPGLSLPRIRCDMDDHSWYLFNVILEPKETCKNIDRDCFIMEMTKRKIGTSVHYKPLHRMTYYKEKYGLKPEEFPNAEWVFQRCVCLPIFSAMKENQLEYVIKNIKEILL